MKSFIMPTFFAAVSSLSLVVSQSANAQSVMPVLRNAPIDQIFVPQGFDDNDTVEVILHGHFSDSCNKIGPALGSVDEASSTVVVGARAFSYNGNECIPMSIPFVQSVKLGQLKAGTYQVQLRGFESTVSKTLTVVPATVATADDNLYAPVEDLSFTQNVKDPSSFKLVVGGLFPKVEGGCLKVKELKAFLAPSPDVLVVLPIAEFEKDVAKCPATQNPRDRMFRVSKKLKLDLKNDLLIHVRVLNGLSLNKVFEVE